MKIPTTTRVYLGGSAMYLKEVQICPNCGARSNILKKQSYGDFMIKYSFQCPECKLHYQSSWKETVPPKSDSR